MEMEEKIKLVLHSVQQNISCHQKNLKILENYYHKISNEDFLKLFFKQLKLIFHIDITVKNSYVEKTLNFLAQFVCALIKPNNDESEQNLEEDSPSHPFLTQVIHETLKYHDLDYVQTRYYSCRFITLILKYIGYETHLDGNICDLIQEAMLERTLDPKASIRLQAVMALVRLQEPLNPECPVITAYLSLLTDANPLIRKEVVKMIAPNVITRPKISERISDVDSHVRIAAYTRCADIGPTLFKIIIRQQILKCGFHETNNQVKNVFLENLLPKWLTAYNGNFLAFLGGLKLDADENDILNTEEISKQVMEAFFKLHPIKDIIDYLPIDNSKLIPLDNLSSEVITYWSIVTNFLRSSDETEEYLEDVAPELTPFCNYIQNIIDLKTSKKMQEWEYLEFQYILYSLFDMAEQYDLADEVGRRTLHKLVVSTLEKHKLQFKLAKKLVAIADKLISNVDVVSTEICQIISDIREPLVETPVVQVENANRQFQIAELKVKINILQDKIEDALETQDFQKAAEVKNELMEYKKKLEDLNMPPQVVMVRASKDDPETICRCLDLLTALLLLPNVQLTPSLETCKTEFLLPLLISNVVEINWRVLKTLTLYSLLDKSIAEEHLKVLCIPIATYRAIPNYNKSAVMVSVSAVCDLMLSYGAEIFGTEEDTNNTTSTQNTTRRRLYRNEDAEDVSVVDHHRMNVEFIIEIILDMLDDENEEIRDTAATAITKLILTDFPVNPLLMSRVILKWFNPLTGIADASSSRAVKLRILENERSADKIQQKLGLLISNYTKLIRGAREVLEKAVIPTLASIANAPRSSPLADVDIENVLRFLAAITDSSETMDIVNIHTNLALSMCFKIASKPSDPVVPYLSKLFLYLEIPSHNVSTVKELITQAEILLEEEDESLCKGPRKNIMKFVEKLKATQEPSDRLDAILENSDDNLVEQRGNGVEEINKEHSTSEEQNRRISATVEDNINVKETQEQKKLTEEEEENNSDSDEIRNNVRQVENGTEQENENNIESNSNNKENGKPEKKKSRNGYINDKNATKKIIENSTSDTDLDSVSEKRKSKRTRKRIDRFDAKDKQKEKRKNVSDTSLTNSNSVETDKDSSDEESPPQPNNHVKNANPGRTTRSNKALSNQDQLRTRSGRNRRDVNNAQQKFKQNKRTRVLKRPREEINKPVCVSEKHRHDNKQGNSATTNFKDKRKNKVCSSDTTDHEGEGNNIEVRRSKRARQILNTPGSRNKSKNNEKENEKNVKNQSSEAQTKKSNGCMESVQNNLHRTLRSSTMNETTQGVSEMNLNGVKRRKSRGKKSQDLDSTGETTLHTIIEQSLQMEILDDMTIQTPTSKRSSSSKSLQLSSSQNSSSVFSTPNSLPPRRSRVIISETSSDSESGSGTSSIRRSARKIKKKNMDNYVS